MNDKTEQSVTDELRRAAKLAAPYAVTMIVASHLNKAADTIDTLRAQLAEAQRDAERWNRAAQCVRLDQFGGVVVTPDEPAFASDVSLAFTREIDAAIRAAKGEKNGT